MIEKVLNQCRQQTDWQAQPQPFATLQNIVWNVAEKDEEQSKKLFAQIGEIEMWCTRGGTADHMDAPIVRLGRDEVWDYGTISVPLGLHDKGVTNRATSPVAAEDLARYNTSVPSHQSNLMSIVRNYDGHMASYGTHILTVRRRPWTAEDMATKKFTRRDQSWERQHLDGLARFLVQ